MQKFNVVVIGAGNIGALFDKPDTSDIFTHAKAFSTHSGFELCGIIDTDKNKADRAAKIWNTKAYYSIHEAFSQENIDVVSIAVPDEYHYQAIKQVMDFNVKLIFSEKPLAKKISEAEEIIKLSEEKNIPIAVNYSRRYVPEIKELENEIKKGFYGDFISGNALYGKGILHNGSHMADLIRLLLGEIKTFSVFNCVSDFYKDDKSYSALLKLCKGGDISLNAINCNNFTIFELDMIFEKARLKIINSGFIIEKYSIKNSETFKGYKNLAFESKIDTSLNKAIYFSTENIYNNLTKGEKLLCSAYDGLEAMNISLGISESRLK